MKMQFGVGDLFLSKDGQTVMLSYVKGQYVLIVTCHRMLGYEPKLDEFEELCESGTIWDDRYCNTLAEMNDLINSELESLEYYIAEVRTDLVRTIPMDVE